MRNAMHGFFRNRAGFTMVEVLIASAISAVAMIALVSMNMMAQRYLAEGAREARILGTASRSVDEMVRQINNAYRLDAETAANVYQIKDTYQTFEFSVPSGTSSVRRRFRYDSATKTIRFEQRSGTTWSNIGTQNFMKEVTDFAVDNQEGIISLIVRVKATLPRYKDRQYTLVGRGLPRNI